MQGQQTKTPFVIAIDGPAGSGKGTLAKLLANHYGLRHLDTGLTYRAVAWALLRNRLTFDNEKVAVEAANQVDFEALDKTQLSAHEIGELASKIAVFPALRDVLVSRQRAFVNEHSGAVLDGRDVATVIYPHANAKIYMFADVESRAKRRLQQIIEQGGKASYAAVLLDIKKRDNRDEGRAVSPLKPADDAYLLNTTKLSIEAAFNAALAYIDPIWKRALA